MNQATNIGILDSVSIVCKMSRTMQLLAQWKWMAFSYMYTELHCWENWPHDEEKKTYVKRKLMRLKGKSWKVCWSHTGPLHCSLFNPYEMRFLGIIACKIKHCGINYWLEKISFVFKKIRISSSSDGNSKPPINFDALCMDFVVAFVKPIILQL